jgi:hypothetical protein
MMKTPIAATNRMMASRISSVSTRTLPYGYARGAVDRFSSDGISRRMWRSSDNSRDLSAETAAEFVTGLNRESVLLTEKGSV